MEDADPVSLMRSQLVELLETADALGLTDVGIYLDQAIIAVDEHLKQRGG
jgi:hypothetical protein